MPILNAFTDFFELIRGQFDNIPRDNVLGDLYVGLNLIIQVVATFIGGIDDDFNIFRLFGGGRF